jgi:DNA-binding transcriptional LysR family regulator
MQRPLDPVTLRLFVAVCEEGHIARAAERGGMAPTAAGEALLRRAREVLGGMERLRAELSEFASGVQGSVREGAADLGVLWDAGDLAGLQTRPYRQDHLGVAMPMGHPWARRPHLRFEDTLDQVSSLDAACRIVAAGLGLAILPREAAAPHADAGRLALVALDEPWAERRFVLCHRAGLLLAELQLWM